MEIDRAVLAQALAANARDAHRTDDLGSALFAVTRTVVDLGLADLAGITEHVTLLEFGDELRADAVLQRKLYSLSNVTVHVQAQTTEITGDGTKVNGLTYTDRKSGESRHVELEAVFVQIGLVPNTEWLKGTVALSRFGEIEVDARGQTSVPGVFAAGDCTTVPYKQIVVAMGAGSTAALGAFDHLIRTPVPEQASPQLAVA